MKVLIIGYGRAGQRHWNLIEKFGGTVVIVDPYIDPNKSDYATLDNALIGAALIRHDYDFAVICSPPDQHLEQIAKCLAQPIYVLCEKPLCGWGQLPEAQYIAKHSQSHKVMPAFNYRWHPDLKHLLDGKAEAGIWHFNSEQYRSTLPDWDLALDHLPHTLDLLLAMAGDKPVEITTAFESSLSGNHWVYVRGTVGKAPRKQVFEISDKVVTEFKIPKQANIIGPWGEQEVNTEPDKAAEMFGEMYRDFLNVVSGRADRFPVGWDEAIRCQELLEQVKVKL